MADATSFNYLNVFGLDAGAQLPSQGLLQACALGRQEQQEGKRGNSRPAPAVFGLVPSGKDSLVNNLANSYHVELLLEYWQGKALQRKQEPGEISH